VKKRGRPKLIRSRGEVILSSGLMVRQTSWIKKNYRRYGMTSAAHFLRKIIDSYIEQEFVKEAQDDLLKQHIGLEVRA
jgi:hypothetical protein